MSRFAQGRISRAAVWCFALVIASPIVSCTGTESASTATRAAASPTSSGEPTLGRVWAPNQSGYGRVRPTKIFNGGDGTGLVTDIRWESWGEKRAIGHGRAAYEPPSAEWHWARATIVAFKLRRCRGRYMYAAVQWYFPQYGEKFDPNDDMDMCPGTPDAYYGELE